MIRTVLDTNVIVSALITKSPSPPFKIYKAFKAQQFLLITSVAILEEVEEVINRRKIVKLHHLPRAKRQAIIENLVSLSYIAPGNLSVKAIETNPEDNKFLACALEGNADFIVSGDKHLLKLKEYQGIKILNPDSFLTELTKK